MKYLNKFITITLYSFMYCNISSLSNASDDYEELCTEINNYINNNHSELSSNTSINQEAEEIKETETDTNTVSIDIDSIDWKYHNQTQNNNNNLKSKNSRKRNKRKNRIHKKNISSNELIEICTLFKNGINIIDNINNEQNSQWLLFKYLNNKIDLSDDLKYIGSLHEFLFNISKNYYFSINKNPILNNFKKIAKEFMEKSENYYDYITMLINIRIKIYNNLKQEVYKFVTSSTNICFRYELINFINMKTKIHNNFINKYSKCLYKLYKYHNNKYSFLD